MSVGLHRLALWFRLLLVCLVLTGVGAPTRTMGYREAVVAVAAATARAAGEREAAPARRAARLARHAPPRLVAWSPQLPRRVAPRLSPARARRIFLINSALLC